MKLIQFQIPEVAHLPPEEREVLLKACNQSPRLQKYRRVAPRFVGPALVGAFFAMFFLGWSQLATVIGVVVALFLLLVIKLLIEVRLLRREARAAVAAKP